MAFFFGISPLIPLPTFADILGALPVILSLVIIEGLLSVDNALAIAAMARHLPKAQQVLALRLGIIGAYLFRGLCMGFAAWIVENPWLKIGGAVYLIYLMCKHFTEADEASENGVSGVNASRGFLGTVVAIELMDLSLSVDNVVAAVAMSPKLWVVCTGVFIGILALRFVAGACLKLIERYPILEETAFLLIGYVGFILVFELITEPGGGLQVLAGPRHVSAFEKFVGIVVILFLSVIYSKVPMFERGMRPVLSVIRVPMKWVAQLVGMALRALLWPFAACLRLFKRSRTSA